MHDALVTDSENERWQALPESLQPDGWFALTAYQADCLALARQEADERGQRRITSLLIVGERVDALMLKKFPIGSVNTTINLHDMPTRDPAEVAPLVSAAREILEDHVARQTELEEQREGREQRQPLTRPDGTDPDAFYRRVAEAYRETAATTRAVAPVLADEAGVPVPTVHRWVLEARRRGFLPPARKGRAG